MEKYFNDFSENEMKSWITDNRVLFATNSNLLPGSMYLASLKTYIDNVPVHNMYIASGFQKPEPFYGAKVFHHMSINAFIDNIFKKYDYIVYIDEDAFVTDFQELMNIFHDFMKDDEYCLGGIQDGGVICHRNHSRLMVNTFVSFWNLKLLRQSSESPKEFHSIVTSISSDPKNSYTWFKNRISQINPSLFVKMKELADSNIDKVTAYRKTHFIDGEVPYCETVKNDPTNPVEPHQIPYSFSDDVETYNFEPYYAIEQAYILMTGKPVYYMYATDLFNKDETECDNSGLTSVILSDEDKPVVVHTWFTRQYTKYPVNKVQLYHTNRINTIITKYGVL